MVMAVLLLSLIYFIVSLVVGTLFLMLVAKIFGQSNVFIPSLKVVLIISLIGFVINLISLGSTMNIILVLGLIVLQVFLIKKFFNINLGRAIGMWVVWAVFIIILSLILTVVMWIVVRNVVQGGIDAINQNQGFLNGIIYSLF